MPYLTNEQFENCCNSIIALDKVFGGFSSKELTFIAVAMIGKSKKVNRALPDYYDSHLETFYRELSKYLEHELELFEVKEEEEEDRYAIS
jgi:hypothetical protein